MWMCEREWEHTNTHWSWVVPAGVLACLAVIKTGWLGRGASLLASGLASLRLTAADLIRASKSNTV